MGIKRNYLESSVDTIMRMNPSFDREEVTKIVTRMMKESLKDPSIIMDNSVTGAGANIKLTELCNWIDKEQPVISGNATFYMQPKVLQSPTSNMLRNMKKERKQIKNGMFTMKAGSSEYQMADLNQNNRKVIMNADYGGSGAPTAAFYTKEGPAATTLMAQSIITTMAALFEGYVGDNQKFFNINECYDWMNKVVQKDEKIPKWVYRPTRKQVSDRIKRHFYLTDPDDFPFIDHYINGCNEDALTYLFYANNIKSFIICNNKPQDLLRSILSSLPLYEAAEKDIPAQFVGQFENVDKYNKWMSEQMFLNPYKTPESIKQYLDEFILLLTQFIYVEYITPDSIEKLNNHKRNTVLLVDTDSNIINADLFVSFVIDQILPGETFSRSRLYNEMILVNVLAASLDKAVVKQLDYYGRCHNMDKESRAELTMKNEFMFRRLFLMKTKKRYAASIVLREGNIMIPFKPELKGLDFIKAGVTDEVTDRFSKMLKDHILYSDELELHELMRDVKSFEREIYHDLKSGGTAYLKTQSFKPEESYKKLKDSNGNVIGTKAWSLPVFRGSIIWNELYPHDRIYSLDRVKIVKLIVTGPLDLDSIKDKYPDEYKMVMEKVFHSSNSNITKSGLKVLCIPATMKKMPDWLIDLIDYDVIVSDVISSFRSVLDSLNIEGMAFKTPNGNANLTSCLVSL